MKKILIAGAGSYIGEAFRTYLGQYPEKYEVDEIETKGLMVSPDVFRGYDAVFCVAGVAHIKETLENRHLYYEINRDLIVSIAKAAKDANIKHFILLSSMSVYGMVTGRITKKSIPHPVNAYGKSKLQADEKIKELENENFKLAFLRPPMVYGKGCKGNYKKLRNFALKSPIFPDYHNQRSMVYIGNLCEFVKNVIDEEKRGLYFPQNADYINTSEMVRLIAKSHGKKIRLTKAFNWLLKIVPVKGIKKVFGNLTYEKADMINKYSFIKSIIETEA